MTSDEQGVLQTIHRYLEGYANGDVGLCLSAVAPTGSLLLFGTNADEMMTSVDEVRAGLERDMAAMSDIRVGTLRHLRIEAAAAQAFALFEVPVSYRASGEETSTVLRFALSLGNDGGQWLIRSGLVSVPFAAGSYTFEER